MGAEFLIGIMEYAAPTIVTIATGVLTITQGAHTVAAEAGVADDLATISLDSDLVTSAAGTTYRPFLILQADTGDTITVKQNTGNILMGDGADFSLTENNVLFLWYNGTNWYSIGE